MEQEVATVALELAKNVLQVQVLAKDGADWPARAWCRRGDEPRGDFADHEAGAEIAPQQSGPRAIGNSWRVRPVARLGASTGHVLVHAQRWRVRRRQGASGSPS